MLVNHDFKADMPLDALNEVFASPQIELIASRSGLTAADLDMSAEATEDEKLALRLRFLIVAGAVTAPWAFAFGIYGIVFG